MRRQSGNIPSLPIAFALAVLLFGVVVIGDGLSQAAAEADEAGWRKVTLLGATAIVEEDHP